jgi:hypothetical protein
LPIIKALIWSINDSFFVFSSNIYLILETLAVGISPSFEIKDDRFDVSQIADCHLLIEVGRDRFRFAIFNTLHNVFQWIEDYHVISILNENQALKAIKNIYQNHHFLAANYWKTIRISVQANYFTLIPDELYKAEDALKYLQFASGKLVSDTDAVFDFKHTNLGAVNIFGVEKEIYLWFKEMYPAKKITPVPVLGTLIEGILNSKKINGLHLYFEENHISIIYFKENKLFFCNRFYYLTPQDLVYHVLFVMNELGIEPEKPVIFYGEITSFSDSYELLSHSLSTIIFATNPPNLSFSQYFDELPEHRYYSLFSTIYTF